MAGSITCPECHKKFKGKGDLLGKKIRCPFCKAPFKVQAEDQGSGVHKESDDDEFDGGSNPYGITKLDLAPRCPNCANEMESEKAVVCLYCGYNTLTRTWGKTEKLVAATFGDYMKHLMPGFLALFGILLLIAGAIAYCLVLPGIKKPNWLAFTEAESLRLWASAGVVGIMWPIGYFAFNRLIVNPRPPDQAKD